MAPSKYHRTYDVNEWVLCFHGPLLYKAKVLEYELNDPKDKRSGYQYKVHYNGWKKTWDDWVAEDRLRKYNEENQELAANLFREARDQQKAESRAKKAANTSHKRKSTQGIGSELASLRDSEDRSSSVAAPTRNKRQRDWDVEKEDSYFTRPGIKLPIPDNLKSLLVDDWENVTKSQMLVPLPHEKPITTVLNDFTQSYTSRLTEGDPEVEILEEIIHGLKEYFDKSIGRILLYRFERKQHLDLVAAMEGKPPPVYQENSNGEERQPNKSLARIKGKTACDVYGAEHLSRLIVSMPELISQTNMDAQAVNRLKEELHKLTQFLAKNATRYFAQDYESVENAYVDDAKRAV